MLNFKKTMRIAAVTTLFALLLPLSLFADSRRLGRTGRVIDVLGGVMRGEAELRGTVTSIDRRSEEFEIATFNGRRVWVDAADADRADRRQIDRLRVGDRVSLSGSFDRDGTFVASSVRADDTVFRDGRRRGDDEDRRFNRGRHQDDDDDNEADDEDDDD